MPALFFPNLDALRLALASGVVPVAVSRETTRAGFDANGHLWLELDEPLPRESLIALGRLGVLALGETAVALNPVRCWAELLPLRRVDSFTLAPTPVLFEVPDRLLAAFVAGVRRLSGAPVGVRLLPEPPVGRAWITVASPPTSLLLLACDPDSDIRVYRQQTPAVWTAWGWEHSLASHLAVPPGGVLLCNPEREIVASPVPVAEPLVEEFPLRVVPTARHVTTSRVHIDVQLRLVASRPAHDETMWVLQRHEQSAFHEFCRGADERLLGRFQIATVSVGAETRLLVRRAADDDRGAVLPISASSYQTDSRLRSLFVPAGYALRPVLRVNVLAQHLPIAADRLVWLEPVGHRTFAIHTVPVAAFHPLHESVEYAAPPEIVLVVERPAEPLFPLGRFTLQIDPLAAETVTEEPNEPESEATPAEPEEQSSSWMAQSVARLLRWMRSRRAAPQEADSPDQRPLTTQPRPISRPAPARSGSRVERELSSLDALLHGHDRAARRHELETRLLADFPRLGADQRAARWAELAGVYGATGRSLDAAVCWVNAIWECPTPPEAWLEQWAAAECRAAKGAARGADLERWLSEPARPGSGRVVASLAVHLGFRTNPPPEFIAALPRVLAILDQQFDDIPLRGAWLARAAVARSCDGDTLGLARWRDRLVRRMHDRGPGLDLDEPSFLRFRTTATAERFQTAREWLTRVREPILGWVQRHAGHRGLQCAGLDGEGDATTAYAQFMLAWGLSVLGERAVSRDWAARARKSLARATGPMVDPTAHTLLADLFLQRIKDAHEGRAPKPVLPTEHQERLDRLPEFARYSVDRLREYSRILEPFSSVQAFQGRNLKEFWRSDRLGERLSVLGSRTDPAQLNEEGRALLAVAAAEPSTATVPRIVFGLLGVGSFLDSSVLTPLLELVPTALDWMEAWVQSGRWSKDERVERVPRFQAALIGSAFAVAPAPMAEQLLDYLTRGASTGQLLPAVHAVAPRVFRAARKFGLTVATESLMYLLNPTRGEWADTSAISAEQIGLAIGWFAAGDEEAGNRILDAARASLFPTTADDPPARTPVPDDPRARTPVALAYAEALGFAPSKIALVGLEEIFQRLQRVSVDSSTNSYFTLQPLRLVDTVVRSVVTDEFTLGATVRAWLDEDEFLIRRRIHRDMATLLREHDLE